jgi:AcrR family transcriptional regulator
MARPRLHPTEAILDGARSIALAAGAGSATVQAIARQTGAPVGSIYHRFSSRDELLARVWIRAVRRSQAGFLAAIQEPDPVDAAVAGALSILDFCRDEPADARLLVAFRREDLIHADLPAELTRELDGLNGPLLREIAKLSKALHGRQSRESLERTLFVVFDLPYGAARRHLLAESPLPRGLWPDLERAIRAVLRRPRDRRPGRAPRRG